MILVLTDVFDEFLCTVARSEHFPSSSYIYGNYPIIVKMSSDDIVSLIMNNTTFVAYIDIIRQSIEGLEVGDVGRSLTRFIDKNFPDIMQRLYSNETEFELFKEVVTRVIGEIRNGRI